MFYLSMGKRYVPLINRSQMCAAGGTGRRQVPVMAVNMQRGNEPLSAVFEHTKPGLCVGLFTDNMLLFLPLTTERLQRTPDLLLVTSHHT